MGGGISGNLVARLLHPEHDVTLFEANDYLGGHANTVDFEMDGNTYSDVPGRCC
ncbi:MAG: NAD(P)-binding protein [Pirellulaceae bacterium]